MWSVAAHSRRKTVKEFHFVHVTLAQRRRFQRNGSWCGKSWDLGVITWQMVTAVTCNHLHTHTHTRLTALFPGLTRWAGTRKVKPIWILLKQETVSGSGISWTICKLAPCSRQTTTPAPHHSVFYRPDALPAAQPTASKHWRKNS